MPNRRDRELTKHFSAEASMNCAMCNTIAQRLTEGVPLTEKQRIHAMINGHYIPEYTRQGEIGDRCKNYANTFVRSTRR